MDFPEAKIVRRILKQSNIDPVDALAALLKTLGDDHLATLPAARNSEPQQLTLFEALWEVLQHEATKNGRQIAPHVRQGEPDEGLHGAMKITGDLFIVQDELGRIVADCLDMLDVYKEDTTAEAA